MVMVVSLIGVPVSTTHFITGGTVGMCLFNNSINSVKWTMFTVIFGGWIVTCLCAGLYWCFTGDLDSQYRGFVGFCSNLGVYWIFWVSTRGLSEFWALLGVYLNSKFMVNTGGLSNFSMILI